MPLLSGSTISVVKGQDSLYKMMHAIKWPNFIFVIFNKKMIHLKLRKSTGKVLEGSTWSGVWINIGKKLLRFKQWTVTNIKCKCKILYLDKRMSHWIFTNEQVKQKHRDEMVWGKKKGNMTEVKGSEIRKRGWINCYLSNGKSKKS